MRRLAVILLWSGFMFACRAQTAAGAGERQKARDLLVAGRPLEAIPLYEALVRKSPASAELRTDLCIANFKARRYREAIVQAEAALKLNPDLTVARLFLGSSYLESGEPDKAIQPLEDVIRAQPEDRNAHLMLAQALHRVGRVREAAAHYQKTAELAPGSPVAWSGLAECYEKLAAAGTPDGERFRALASEAWDRLLRLPRSRESLIHEARLLEGAGEYIEAAQKWREALRFSPGDAAVKWSLTWSLYRGRDYRAALGLLSQLERDSSTAADLNFLEGACLLNLQQPAQSIPYLEKALQLDSQLLPAHLALGQAYLQTKMAKQAIPHLRAALSLDEDGSGHFQLFRACQMAGDVSAASRALEAYRRFQPRPVH